MALRNERITTLVDITSAEELYKAVGYSGDLLNRVNFVQVCLKHIASGHFQAEGWTILGKRAADDLITFIQSTNTKKKTEE